MDRKKEWKKIKNERQRKSRDFNAQLPMFHFRMTLIRFFR